MLHGLAIDLLGEAPRASEIVLGAGAADRGVLFIVIDVEFEFAFTPPVALKRGQCQVGTYIMPSPSRHQAPHSLSPFSKALAPPLCVEIGNVIVERLVIHGVVNLVEKCADAFLCWFSSVMRARAPNGIEKYMLKPRFGTTATGMEFTRHARPNPQQKKSPSGHSTLGSSSSSQ